MFHLASFTDPMIFGSLENYLGDLPVSKNIKINSGKRQLKYFCGGASEEI